MDAYSITRMLQGRWHGDYGTAPCPICQQESRNDQNALTVAEGATGLLLHCKKSACGFREVVTVLKLPRRAVVLDPATRARQEAKYQERTISRSVIAQKLWDEASPVQNTIAAIYLRNRGITCPLPGSLRFHREIWHGPTRCVMPAMVARVDGSAGFAVHRTWLGSDGADKARVMPAKAMLGKTAGGAVRLVKAVGPLVVAEGIETALSLVCMLHHPASVWAALSTSGLRGLKLPDQPGRLILAPDGDNAGRSAANALAERAREAGWRVLQRDPGDHSDWNDVLQAARVS